MLSAVNTPEYALAKWIEVQLKPFLSDKYSVASSSAFVSELCQIKPGPTDIIVSYDIKSLYTNVPLDQVIKDITDTVYADTASSRFFIDSGIPKRVLKNILKLCSESIFLYKGMVYKQRDGVAMGSPLAPLLANWFVATVEDRILSDVSLGYCKPAMYKRYVDDIFAVFQSNIERDQFLDILNQAHQNLTFTMETSTSSLPFLDVSISIKDGSYHTAVYRKPTNTGVLMHYDSMAPRKWKRALVNCLLNRAHRISSNFISFVEEADNIKSILSNNGYPIPMITTLTDEFIKLHNINKDNYKREPESRQQHVEDDNIKKTYFTVPFVGKPSTKLQNSVKREMENYGIELISSYSTLTVGSHFNLKSNCSRPFRSNVVYKFTCSADRNVSYVGETRRHLFRRVSDHNQTDNNSAIFEHLYLCRNCQNSPNILDQFEILKACEAKHIYSFEALLIFKHRPCLNTQLGPGRGTKTSLSLY